MGKDYSDTIIITGILFYHVLSCFITVIITCEHRQGLRPCALPPPKPPHIPSPRLRPDFIGTSAHFPPALSSHILIVTFSEKFQVILKFPENSLKLFLEPDDRDLP